jgi:hypothetical protein
MAFWQKASRNQRRTWTLGASVIAGGAVFKVRNDASAAMSALLMHCSFFFSRFHALQYAYFDLTRGLLVDDMDRRHVKAHEHLVEARKFAEWSEKDRQSRTPPLTAEQHRQLQAYLDIRRELQEEQLQAIERGETVTPQRAER